MDDANELQTWQYQGGGFGTTNNWLRIDGGSIASVFRLSTIYSFTNGFYVNGDDISGTDNFWQQGTLDDNGNFSQNSESSYLTSDFIDFENVSVQKYSAIEASLCGSSFSLPNVCYYKKESHEFVYGFQLIALRAVIFIPNGYSVRIVRNKNQSKTVIFSGSASILKKAISNEDLTDGAVTTDKIADNSINASKLIDGLITERKVADSSITERKTTFIERLTEQFIPTSENSEYSETIYEAGGGTHTSSGWGSNIIPIDESWVHINWHDYGNNTNAGAFLNEEKEIFFPIKNGATTTEMDVPIGAKYLALTVNSNSLVSKPIIVTFIGENFTIPKLELTKAQKNKLLSDTNEKIAKISDGLNKNILENIDITDEIYSEITAFTTNVGQAPTANEDVSSQYGIKGKIYSTEGINSFHLESKSGGTCRLWAKMSDGIVTEMAAYSATVTDIDIECDGTFDQIVINLYEGTAQKVVSKNIVRLDNIEENIESINENIENIKQDISTTKTMLKILMFGNSFTHDSVGYVPYILNQIVPNIDLKIGIAMYSGCSLAQHLANLTGETIQQGSVTYTPGTYGYSVSKEDCTWDTTWGADGNDILAKEDWDIVTFQQNGDNIDKDWDSYFVPYIYKLQKIVYDKVNKSVKLGWIIAHSSYSGTDLEKLKTRYEASIVNAKKIFDNTLCQVVLPYGTAIQNLRGVYQSLWGGQSNLLSDDNVHLQEGLPTLTAAYTHVIKILDLIGMSYKSIVGDDTNPTKEWVQKYALGPNYFNNEVMSVNENNRFIAQTCAIQAVKSPYKISDLAEVLINYQ